MVTKARPLGNVARRALGDVQDTLDRNAQLLRVVVEDITDGDGDNTRAIRAAGELFANTACEATVLSYLITDNMTAAETTAMRLASSEGYLK